MLLDRVSRTAHFSPPELGTCIEGQAQVFNLVFFRLWLHLESNLTDTCQRLLHGISLPGRLVERQAEGVDFLLPLFVLLDLSELALKEQGLALNFLHGYRVNHFVTETCKFGHLG